MSPSFYSFCDELLKLAASGRMMKPTKLKKLHKPAKIKRSHKPWKVGRAMGSGKTRS